jgi:copper chaperone
MLLGRFFMLQVSMYNFCIPLGGIGIYEIGRRTLMSHTIRLTIEGMHCGSCVRRVTTALTNVVGVRADEVVVGSATVEYDNQRVHPEVIVKAIENIGFGVKAFS